MAHDYHGEELKVGDLVMVAAVVKEIDGEEERGSNITVETIHPSFPHPSKSAFSLNSRQIERVDISEEDPALAPEILAPAAAAPADADETAPAPLPEQPDDAPTDPGIEAQS